MLIAGAVIAHQGGWDEILMVVGPLAAIAGLLVLAKRRASQLGPVATTPGTKPAEGTTPKRDGSDPLDVGSE